MEKLPLERQHYVLDNLNLVHYILRKTFHMEVYYDNYEDYFQEGCIGLILAAIRFDEDKGFKFSTYAGQMIIGSIQRYKRDRIYPVKIPRDKYEIVTKIVVLSAQGHSLDDIELITGYSGLEIQKCLSIMGMNSLDSTITNDEGDSLDTYEIISDNKDYYSELLSEENVFSAIQKSIESFKIERSRDIWEEYIWSTYYGEELTQMYLANKYNVSQAQVCRILKNGKVLISKYLLSSK